jgi:outer membrane protein assembly factor BamA
MSRLSGASFTALAILMACLFPPLPLNGQSNVEVTGLGFFRNRALDQRLAFLSGIPESETRELAYADVEDSAYLLLQLLKRKGYPNPRVSGTLNLADGQSLSVTWELPFVSQVSRASAEAVIERVRFTCDPGMLSFYRSIEIDGLTALDAKLARDFFLPSGVLFTRRTDRAFTPANFDSRINRLLAVLRSEGYRQAKVVQKDIERDPDSGAVDLELVIEEGPVFRVGKVETLIRQPEGVTESEESEAFQGAILNRDWLRERRQELLNRWYAAGYPEARVTVQEQAREAAEEKNVIVDVRFQLETGPLVKLAAVDVEPESLLVQSVFQRQVKLETGSVFNLLDVEEGRRRLLSLGVFRDVTVEEDFLEPGQAAARYVLDPLPRRTLKLLVGWGSYELGRIGASWEHLNLWQRAHRYELVAKKSFKSHLVEGTYVVPHFFDERITAYGRLGHEFREEISFDRTTTRFSLGASRQLALPGAEVSVEYAYENVDTTRGTERDFAALDRATVSSLTVRGILDRRNSIVDPVRGYDLNMSVKTATDLLGGEANFQRLEAGTSYHRYLGTALYMHVSFRYGTIFSRSPTSVNLPFNERFFPGGENTVRGYQRGEASPITLEGEEIGAESYALGNLELEQRVLRNFSVIVFWDGIGISEEQAAWPRDDFLQSVGIGLRWRTAVGPVRLEYGHNIDPRVGDPDGTLHFAVGYPF